jgi:glycosyltransferase 2 family protein
MRLGLAEKREQRVNRVRKQEGSQDQQRTCSLLAFGLRLGLGAACLGLFLWLYGARHIMHALERERPEFFAAAIILYLAGQVMSSYRWMLLARITGLAGRAREYLAYYFIGMFTNLFVPGLVGGDAARSAFVGVRNRRMGEAVASVIADRGVGLAALFWFAAIAALTVTSVSLPRELENAVVAIGALSLLGYLSAPLLVLPVRHLTGRLAQIVRPLIPYCHAQVGLILPLALSLVLQGSLAFCQYLLAIGMRLNVPVSAMMLVVPMANVAASLPLTFNGLGVREGVYLLLFGMAGVPHQDAVALGLAWFSCTMIGGLAGVVPFVITPMPRAVEDRPTIYAAAENG